jgi:hypothetical protein
MPKLALVETSELELGSALAMTDPASGSPYAPNRPVAGSTTLSIRVAGWSVLTGSTLALVIAAFLKY